MPILTERTREEGKVRVDEEKCNLCGLCIEICKDFSLEISGGKVRMSSSPLFGCIACGHCAAVCPVDAITVTGREMSPEDFIPLPDKTDRSGYEALYALLRSRRSIRDFREKAVEKETIDKIVDAASTAPMGIPPSDVQVVVLNGKEKVREFSWDFIDILIKSKFFFSPFSLALMRPFMKKTDYEMTKSFIPPLIQIMEKGKREGKNWLLYDAPLAMYFNSSVTDPADPYISATYAMIAAESLGLGSCMIGSIAPFVKYGAKSFKKKWGIHPNTRYGIVVVFGYPKYKFRKSIRRTFAKVLYP